MVGWARCAGMSGVLPARESQSFDLLQVWEQQAGAHHPFPMRCSRSGRRSTFVTAPYLYARRRRTAASNSANPPTANESVPGSGIGT